MADDPSATLEEIRAYGYSWCRTGNAAFAQSDRASRDVPRLLAALEGALKRHRPVIRKQGHPAMCEWDNRRWPCPEVADITRALNGDTDV